jgi:hypothetical protein
MQEEYNMGKRGKTGEHNIGRKRHKSNSWKGGKTITHGYVYVYHPNHPNSTINGYVLESKYFMSKTIGRAIKNNEIIHHIDGNIKNNNLENLQLMSRSEHAMWHGKRHNNLKTFQFWPTRGEVICDGCGIKFYPKRPPRCKQVFCSKQCWLSNH